MRSSEREGEEGEDHVRSYRYNDRQQSQIWSTQEMQAKIYQPYGKNRAPDVESKLRTPKREVRQMAPTIRNKVPKSVKCEKRKKKDHFSSDSRRSIATLPVCTDVYRGYVETDQGCKGRRGGGLVGKTCSLRMSA